MKMKILTVSMALAAMVFTSCEKDGKKDGQKWVLRLSSGVATEQTRASFGIDKQIAGGEKVSVYVDNTSNQIYGNNVLTANGSGGFTGGEIMYFPSDRSNLDIYSFHTNGTLNQDFPIETITHTVNQDQSLKANYAASDLLYSAHRGIGLSKDAIELTFYHMLSKVEVALKMGAGNPDLFNAEVYIVGIQPKADFIPSKLTDMTTSTGRGKMIGLTSVDNDAVSIKIGNDITSNEDWAAQIYTYNEAVIVPQKLAQDAKFIKVKLSTGTELFYELTEDTIFESGKKYSYQITVNLTELTVVSSIADWEAVNPVAGNAEME